MAARGSRAARCGLSVVVSPPLVLVPAAPQQPNQCGEDASEEKRDQPDDPRGAIHRLGAGEVNDRPEPHDEGDQAGDSLSGK